MSNVEGERPLPPEPGIGVRVPGCVNLKPSNPTKLRAGATVLYPLLFVRSVAALLQSRLCWFCRPMSLSLFR